jgi:hypothetical protein
MPSLPALFRVALYWLVWLLAVRRVFQAHTSDEVLSTLGWLAGLTALAAWFTWVKVVDDRKARLYGDDYSPDDVGSASPATRFVGAVVLVLGGCGALLLAVMLPEGKAALFGLAGLAFVVAVVFLFFGRRSPT